MCGLIGAVAHRNVTPLLLDGLKRLEYRGYDSAGIAVLDGARRIGVQRRVGRVVELAAAVDPARLSSGLGIGHTRWATHGVPEERNAHPHVSGGEVAVVHNGIIENYEALRETLRAQGYAFDSDTDSEAVVHLIHSHLRRGLDLFAAVQAAVAGLAGAYAIAVIAASEPGTLVAARRGSPLVIGIGTDEHFVASDAMALLPLTDRLVFPEEGDVVQLRSGAIAIRDAGGRPAQRAQKRRQLAANGADKGPYAHFMLKEICEQPDALADTLRCWVDRAGLHLRGLALGAQGLIDGIRGVHIVACGTSRHAGEVARYWLESLARIPVSVEPASEYRYRQPVVPPGTLFLGISQSGETADTLAALRYAAQASYLTTLAICNVPGSSLEREAAMTVLTRAGPELGVASTKAFTTQLVVLLALALLLARRQADAGAAEPGRVGQLRRLSGLVESVLQLRGRIAAAARRFGDCSGCLFIGRGTLYPIACEGALKLKEISYVHAEAHAAGELKHGPLALVDASMPVIVLAPSGALLEKLKSNLREVQARRGRVLAFTDRDSGIVPGDGIDLIEMPRMDELLAPLVYTVALQLFAYEAAVLRGADIDKPRNLAKSVTVE